MKRSEFLLSACEDASIRKTCEEMAEMNLWSHLHSSTKSVFNPTLLYYKHTHDSHVTFQLHCVFNYFMFSIWVLRSCSGLMLKETQLNLQHFVMDGHWRLLGNSCLPLPHCGKTRCCLNYCNKWFDHHLFYRFIRPNSLQAK